MFCEYCQYVYCKNCDNYYKIKDCSLKIGSKLQMPCGCEHRACCDKCADKLIHYYLLEILK